MAKAFKRIRIGRQIKAFRLHFLNMGLRRFAEFMGMKASQLCNVENGRLSNEDLKIDAFEITKNVTTTGKEIVEQMKQDELDDLNLI